MTEIASKGKGTVVEVGPCPEIADGEGEVVIGRFVTARSLEVVRLTMPDGTTLTGTRVHPIWSVDQQDWVRMDELQVGEHLQTRLGPMPIASTEHVIDPQPVYNLEINGQHAYEVTELGILVHNNLWCELMKLRGDAAAGRAHNSVRLAELEELLAAAKRLGIKNIDELKVVDGVLNATIDITQKFSRADLDALLAFAKQSGARQVVLSTGQVVKPSIAYSIQLAIDRAKSYLGGTPSFVREVGPSLIPGDPPSRIYQIVFNL